MRRHSPFRAAGLDALTVAALLLFLLPIVWMFLASVKPEVDIMSGNLWPAHATFDHYRAILAKSDFLTALRNSLVVGLTVAAVTTALAAPAAYSLSRFTYPGRNAFSFLILGTQMLPSVAILVPIVVLV